MIVRPGSVAHAFHSLSVADQCACAILACEIAVRCWERLVPEAGEAFTIPDVMVFGTVGRSFGRDAVEATRCHLDHVGAPMASTIEQLCLDLDLAIAQEEVGFAEPAVHWAACAFVNLVLATTGKQTWVSEDIPYRNPFLLAVNQALTAVAFGGSRKPGETQDWSTDSLDPQLLDAVIEDWWESCQASVIRVPAPPASFEMAVAALRALADDTHALATMLQGFEFADERGALDAGEARRLADARHDEARARSAFDETLAGLRATWPEAWANWLVELATRVEAVPDQDSGLASAATTLRAEATRHPATLSLSWALWRATQNA